MKPQRAGLQHLCIVVSVLIVSLLRCSVPVTRTTLPPNAAPLLVTNTPTLTLIPLTCTPTPSPVSPPRTPLPTWTPKLPTSPPVPTLTGDEEQALVLDLLLNNAGCRLPCWWGFTPGETPWQTAQTFFASLGKTTARYSDSRVTNYSVDFSVPQHSMHIGQLYDVRNGIIDMIVVGARTVRNHEIVYGDTQFAEDWQHYMLPQLLATYGQPTEVLLKTYFSTPEGWIPFHLLLFYPQQGILVLYYGPTERRGEQIRVCPQQTDIHLYLWSSGREMTLEDIANTGYGFPVEEIPDFRSLEVATGWSIEQFYQTFVQLTNQVCLETPADMW